MNFVLPIPTSIEDPIECTAYIALSHQVPTYLLNAMHIWTQNSTENPKLITIFTTVTAEIWILNPEIKTLVSHNKPSKLNDTKKTHSPTNNEMPIFVIISIASTTAAIASNVSSNKTPLIYVY